jgi:multidrug resistance efflux pump
MTHASLEDAGARPAQPRIDLTARWLRPAARSGARFRWRLIARFAIGAGLLMIGLVTLYQQLVVRVSRDAVINARVVVIRAPMDGIVKLAATGPGTVVEAGMPVGRIEDPMPDDARAFELQQEFMATERERTALSRRLVDLQHSRSEANGQADAYQQGRIRQDEMRVEEARAGLAAATARAAEAAATQKRGATLHLHGYMSDETYERLGHASDVAGQDAVAARRRVDGLIIDLEAARSGTYLGDNYNDVPSSLQRARELTVRIDEATANLDQLTQKGETIASELGAERQRLAARSSTMLTAPIDGDLWTAQAAAGEYVRKGQELFALVDCASVVVTAAVAERDYNVLRLGDPVRFRVAGTEHTYSGRISKLGLTSLDRSFAITPEDRRHQVVVQSTDLLQNAADGCAVGRTGEVIFDGGRHNAPLRVVEALRRFLGLA